MENNNRVDGPRRLPDQARGDGASLERDPKAMVSCSADGSRGSRYGDTAGDGRLRRK